jgi:hypothetical protein
MRALILLLLTLILGVPAGASNRMLTTEFEVKAPIEKAWRLMQPLLRPTSRDLNPVRTPPRLPLATGRNGRLRTDRTQQQAPLASA